MPSPSVRAPRSTPCRSRSPAPSSRRRRPSGSTSPWRRRLGLVDGLMNAAAFSSSFFSSKEVLPMGAWMIDVLSTRNSILPPLISRTALPTSMVTVPAFGLGMRPLGPSTLPRLSDQPHHVGRRHERLELQEALLDLGDEVLAAHVVGAGVLRFLDLVARRDDGDPLGLARAVRQDDRAADHLVRVLRVDARAASRCPRTRRTWRTSPPGRASWRRERVGTRLDLRLRRRELLAVFAIVLLVVQTTGCSVSDCLRPEIRTSKSEAS